jgi:hypothetical protein
MKSREWLEKAIALEGDVTPFAGGHGVRSPRQTKERKAAKAEVVQHVGADHTKSHLNLRLKAVKPAASPT